ncbi:hypothetical protein H5U35_03975 [Candidatus Aerophobetes bacterium]|nr:hypothetical protein [Candidatus Aerophobetes bacterium]
MPEENLNVNGVLMGLAQCLLEIFFALLETLFSAVEERIIEKIQEKFPGRSVRKIAINKDA